MGKSRASIYLIKLYYCCLEILLLLLLFSFLLLFFFFFFFIFIISYIIAIAIVLTNCKLPRHSEVYDCM